MSPGGTAFARELQLLRGLTKAYHLKVVASFGCDNVRCPVETVRIAFIETDASVPAQAPIYCNRCRQELTKYVGIQRS